MMNKRIVTTGMVLIMLLLASCKTAWDRVVLPGKCNSFSFSPHLDWLVYRCNDDLWLASLPSLQNAVSIAPTSDTSAVWSTYTSWMPDGTGFLMKSSERAQGTETWWLVKIDNLNARIRLCTQPDREKIVIWSPSSTAFVTIHRGGGVTLVYADGSGCEELPIPGLVMLTPTISWSPDGQKIAYVHILHSEGADVDELRIIDLNTHQTMTVYADAGLAEWFPDGKTIALFGWDEVIPMIRADGSGLVGEIEIPDGYEIMRSRGNLWSPNGSRLALYLKVEGPDYKPVAIGILDRDTLVISVFEVPYFSEILGWTSDGSAVVTLTHEAIGTVLKKISIEH
jgi:Tol biopolymer transport system component